MPGDDCDPAALEAIRQRGDIAFKSRPPSAVGQACGLPSFQRSGGRRRGVHSPRGLLGEVTLERGEHGVARPSRDIEVALAAEPVEAAVNLVAHAELEHRPGVRHAMIVLHSILHMHT